MPDRDSMVYIDRVETKWPLRIQLPIGTHVPFYCTPAIGQNVSRFAQSCASRTLRSCRTAGGQDFAQQSLIRMSFCRRLTERVNGGHSQDDEEFMEGMIALAVPIRDGHGRLLSTLSFHAPTQRLSLSDAHGVFTPDASGRVRAVSLDYRRYDHQPSDEGGGVR